MAKTFYCAIASKEQAGRNENYTLLKQACERRGIDFIDLYAPKSAYDASELPVLKPGGLYRVSPGDKRLAQYVYMLREKNPALKTWFNPEVKVSGGGMPWYSDIKAQLKGISILPTLFGLSGQVDDELINKIEERLDGFPVIVKKTGASHGAGVAIVDSAISLKTVVGHITGQANPDSCVLRKFIPNARHFRVVVVGDKAVSSIEYRLPANDIRTNVTDTPDVIPATPSTEILDLAVQSTQNIGVFFGGVDILVDEAGKAYIAEVNTPCNFSRNQKCAGDDVAGHIVEFLCESA